MLGGARRVPLSTMHRPDPRRQTSIDESMVVWRPSHSRFLRSGSRGARPHTAAYRIRLTNNSGSWLALFTRSSKQTLFLRASPKTNAAASPYCSLCLRSQGGRTPKVVPTSSQLWHGPLSRQHSMARENVLPARNPKSTSLPPERPSPGKPKVGLNS